MPSAKPVITTNVPAFENPPPAGIYDGNGSFSNVALAGLILGVPWFIKRMTPFVNRGGWKTYFFFVVLLGVPITLAYWTLMSMYGARKNDRVQLPGKNIEDYIVIHDHTLKTQYHGKEKIPMQVFYDAYFEQKIDIKGDVLEVLENRHDFTKMIFTPELFRHVLFKLIPDVIFHTQNQDQEQIRDNYDRGDDFYGWFLGPRMVYTSGIRTSLDEPQTLEQLQDNKLTVVCEKLNLKPEDRLLDIGCGWGTLIAFANKNYSCDATGVTLAEKQAAFGNQRIKDNGCDTDRARILCKDYREIPGGPGSFTKIVSLEMAEHVGLRRYDTFLRQVYDLLDDDGTFVFQVAGLRPHWQFEDLIWGIFMNKYIFPGADASASLGWVVSHLESCGWEVKNIDVLGVHYSATIYHWYLNWVSNREKVVEAYGEWWYRLWVFFLAWSVIIARNGGSSVFQFTLHKNLNSYPRILGVENHASIKYTPKTPIQSIS
ncbi:sphingolipid C9-methyltransferase [Vararia minispora EC-137]|uniref:Sphingolipid C9-methyltransferase n=1 Tax=Vararia minispora EC-137 TaxID=1314806 RepID=A0ACB8QDJ5_9AGAM|nr:sphingolipid C9-methyltransferase [Vararia minispora EC-137]